ncbi:MAG: winged helix-turn-helix transcriptional regulator [Clostridiales bacterium]|nr:winged helix-turn-helix transcriptional regulator [Clostridiales bacterium]
MTQRELEVLNIIRDNPMASQKEIADKLGLTRSSVAVHITNLLKKGAILGKGYVVGGEEYVSVLGGANIDIQGFPGGKLRLRDSNPGKISMSVGGVGRNVAENMARLGIGTKLMTYLGEDLYGEKILRETQRAGVDMSHSETLRGESSGAYLSMLDETGDMKVAVADMAVFDMMDSAFIDRKRPVLDRSAMIVMDTNLPEEVIRYTLSSMPERKFIIDTVSVAKSAKIKELLGSFHTLKPNRYEAEALTGISISDNASLAASADYFHKKGVRDIFIGLGADGTFYSDGSRRGIIKAENPLIINATGAGDAFVAGLVLGNLRGWDIEHKAVFATGAALVAMAHKDTINPYISEDRINQLLKESKIIKEVV